MQRWILKAGAVDVGGLVLEEAPIPNPGPGEVRVRVHAVSLNYRDQIILTGKYGQAATEYLIPVSDGAGVIDAVGSGVSKWNVNDLRCRNLFQRLDRWSASSRHGLRAGFKRPKRNAGRVRHSHSRSRDSGSKDPQPR